MSLAPTDIANIVASLSNEQVRMAKELQTYLSTTAAEWGNEASMNMFLPPVTIHEGIIPWTGAVSV